MNRAKRMHEVAGGYVESGRFSSLEWQVEHRGEVLSSGRAGHADALAGTPLPEAPFYRIYSMTKPMISVLALMLMERGKLRLYDAVAQFDRAFAAPRVLLPSGRLLPAERPILVEDLLTHRAGFTYEFITGCHIAPLYQEREISGDGRVSLEEMMRRLAELPLTDQPGAGFRYSVATDVLAHVIERAAGRPVDELLKAYLLEPLGMDETGYRLDDQQRRRLLPMFGVSDISEFAPLTPMPQELKYADVEDMYPVDDANFRRGGHGLFSTLADYLKFARFLLDGRSPAGETLLSRKTLELLCANRIPARQLPLTIGMNPLPGYGFGLGVRIMLDPGQALSLCSAGEFGWAGAAATYFWVDPAEQMVGVILTQYLGSQLPMADDMRSAAYQMLP